MKKVLLLNVLFWIACALQAQTRQINGQVMDKTNDEKLIGVNIVIKEPYPTISDAYQGVNWYSLRLSDVMLMFAEAENELKNGPTPEAKSAF